MLHITVLCVPRMLRAGGTIPCCVSQYFLFRICSERAGLYLIRSPFGMFKLIFIHKAIFNNILLFAFVFTSTNLFICSPSRIPKQAQLKNGD